jgi:hypothetical protein
MLISMSEKPTHLSLNGKMGEDEMVMIYKWKIILKIQYWLQKHSWKTRIIGLSHLAWHSHILSLRETNEALLRSKANGTFCLYLKKIKSIICLYMFWKISGKYKWIVNQMFHKGKQKFKAKWYVD